MPSQLYISKEKLKNVMRLIKYKGLNNLEPIPIKKLIILFFIQMVIQGHLPSGNWGLKKLKLNGKQKSLIGNYI
ncbi:hypothetical protein H17ap60334_07303 [Thermosipho africanus H17ap60334]|nr:hypothetical protein H17ap60334_07303 [Thermosipho africanus H17ap60334]